MNYQKWQVYMAAIHTPSENYPKQCCEMTAAPELKTWAETRET